MKRLWLGVGILIGLLVMGILVTELTDRQLEGMAHDLRQAAHTRDWDRAVALAQQAREDWDGKEKLMAALADHGDLEQIETGFAQLEVYETRREETDHAALCAQLAQTLTDLQDIHKLTWWNLL